MRSLRDLAIEWWDSWVWVSMPRSKSIIRSAMGKFGFLNASHLHRATCRDDAAGTSDIEAESADSGG